MTVSDLIEILENMPQDAEVFVYGNEEESYLLDQVGLDDDENITLYDIRVHEE
jgi:hypothetical protein